MTEKEQDPLVHAEQALKKLKSAYEKYFVGIERVEPAKERDALKKEVHRLLTDRTINTARKFRIQSLQASLITHESYWDRVVKQIEEGTHRRDVFRLRQRERQLQDQAQTESSPQEEQGTSQQAKPTTREKQPVQRRTAFPDSLVKLHDAYLRARVSTGDNRPLSIDAFATIVKKTMTNIKTQYKCQRVEFKVAVKQGKAVLKAVPK